MGVVRQKVYIKPVEVILPSGKKILVYRPSYV